MRQISVNKLLPWEKNPRPSVQAISAVAKSIAEFGFNVRVLCDENLTVIAGHTRLEAAKRLGIKKVPACVLSLEDRDRALVALAENKTSELAEWDKTKSTPHH